MTDLPWFAAVEAIPNAAPELWAKWRDLVNTQAPDLAEMLGVDQ